MIRAVENMYKKQTNFKKCIRYYIYIYVMGEKVHTHIQSMYSAAPCGLKLYLIWIWMLSFSGLLYIKVLWLSFFISYFIISPRYNYVYYVRILHPENILIVLMLISYQGSTEHSHSLN